MQNGSCDRYIIIYCLSLDLIIFAFIYVKDPSTFSSTDYASIYLISLL